MPGASQHEVKVYSGRGHVVGVVRAGVLQLGASASRHMLRKPPAWCVELTVIEQAERQGADEIRIRDRDSGTVYTVNLNDFRRLAFPVNHGFGDQLGLKLADWRTDGKPNVLQLSLFGRDA